MSTASRQSATPPPPSPSPSPPPPRHHDKRWSHVRRVLERPGPFCSHEFTASSANIEFLMNSCKLCVIGAGGLGCELLKDLAMMGFRDIHCIDMDTIDLSNLNRQFLFRHSDIGQSKAECAARFINARVPGCVVTAHHAQIQDFDEDFYRQFHIVVCGLDSIVARRWINGMIFSLLQFSGADGTLDANTIVPLVDGGTEGFKGNARVILSGVTACIECTLDLYPPQVTYPLCTIATTPRLPEHCIEYVKVILWDKVGPFDQAALDGDDPAHLMWVWERAQERAAQFGIGGLTYRLVQGVLKNIIPAVASTNAVIAAACATEVFKLATACFAHINNYLVFNDADAVFTYLFEAERRPDCLCCSTVPRIVQVQDPNCWTLENLIEHLRESKEFQMRAPGLTTMVGGRNRTLYMSTVKSIEESTRKNLTLSLGELGLQDGQEINVADQTSPQTMIIKLRYASNEVEML